MIDFGGNGNGNIKSEPIGINCNSDDDECKHVFKTTTWVTLKPTPAADSEFQYWGGAPDCSDGKLFMLNNKLCTAYFKFKSRTLTVTVKGKGKITGKGKLNNKIGRAHV